jgi:integrase
MSVRRRKWTAPNGEIKEAWIVDYRDQHRKRHIETFARRRDADARHAQIAVGVRAGTHTADRDSATVAKAGEGWLASAASAGLERATLAQYESHLRVHIVPLLGEFRLAQLTVPLVNEFRDRLAQDSSPVMVRKVMVSLSSLVSDAMARGLVAQNVVRNLGRSRRSGHAVDKRQRGKLQVGTDIPTPAEISAIIAALTPKQRPLMLTAIFTGLRSSELRGLRWTDVDLKRAVLHVRQRADRYQQIGPPKSVASERAVPLPPMLVNTLREWKLAAPGSGGELVFGTRRGRPLHLSDIIDRWHHPAQIAAGVVTADGGPKYSGMHALRHFFASLCINRKIDGGLELPLKIVQTRLGHASIQMTADRYAHLFPAQDGGAELAAVERALVGQ